MNKMSQELRLIRKNYPLPISRQAYAKIYDKARETFAAFKAQRIADVGTVDRLFAMLAASYTRKGRPAAADCPVLYGIYCCIRADVEAARLRSVKARERAARRTRRDNSSPTLSVSPAPSAPSVPGKKCTDNRPRSAKARSRKAAADDSRKKRPLTPSDGRTVRVRLSKGLNLVAAGRGAKPVAPR